MDDLQLTATRATAAVFTGEDEQFAHRRTVSRLTEMQTRSYWADAARTRGLRDAA